MKIIHRFHLKSPKGEEAYIDVHKIGKCPSKPYMGDYGYIVYYSQNCCKNHPSNIGFNRKPYFSEGQTILFGQNRHGKSLEVYCFRFDRLREMEFGKEEPTTTEYLITNVEEVKFRPIRDSEIKYWLEFYSYQHKHPRSAQVYSPKKGKNKFGETCIECIYSNGDTEWISIQKIYIEENDGNP